MTEQPLFYEVIDCYESTYHTGYGKMAFVKTLKEAEALVAILHGKWDGCDKGSYNLKIKPIFEKDFGLQKYAYLLCLHEWSDKLRWGEVHVCKKCGRGVRDEYLKKNNTILPKYDGIGYWDETTKQMVFPDEDRSKWQRSI